LPRENDVHRNVCEVEVSDEISPLYVFGWRFFGGGSMVVILDV
jgi:hypothetical protein